MQSKHPIIQYAIHLFFLNHIFDFIVRTTPNSHCILQITYQFKSENCVSCDLSRKFQLKHPFDIYIRTSLIRTRLAPNPKSNCPKLSLNDQLVYPVQPKQGESLDVKKIFSTLVGVVNFI